MLISCQVTAEGAGVKSFATVAAWLHDPQTVGHIYSGDRSVQRFIAAGEVARREFEQTGKVKYVAAHSSTDRNAAMLGADYYSKPDRGAIAQWKNQFAVMSWSEWLRFDALAPAPKIAIPTLLVHSNNSALPDNVWRFYNNVSGPKDLFWTQGQHSDFYDKEPYVTKAVQAAAAHFNATLSNAKLSHFAREGAKVFFCGRREKLGKQVEAKIKGFGGEATYMRADVRNEVDVKAFIDGCVQKYGRIDIAFNNAGIYTPERGSIDEQPLADFEDVMRTNAFGVFLSMKYEMPVLLRNELWGAFGTRGVVVNNASTSGHVGFANISPYSASKHAILGLTRCAALEYSPRGIRVVSISPGGVDTPMRHRAYEGRVAPGQPDPPAPNLYQRTNTVPEMADVVMFLASNAGSSITGTDLDVTGGYHTGPHITTVRS